MLNVQVKYMEYEIRAEILFFQSFYPTSFTFTCIILYKEVYDTEKQINMSFIRRRRRRTKHTDKQRSNGGIMNELETRDEKNVNTCLMPAYFHYECTKYKVHKTDT